MDFLTLKYWFLSLKFVLISHILNLVWNFECFKCFISYEKPNVWAEKEVLHLATTTAFYLFSPLKERILIYLENTRQVSSMIHSANPHSRLVGIIVFTSFSFTRFWKVGTDGRTDGRHVRKLWFLPSVTLGWPSGSINVIYFHIWMALLEKLEKLLVTPVIKFLNKDIEEVLK